MRRKVDRGIIESLKHLKQSLSPKLFADNLKRQLNLYDISKDFLIAFVDDLNTDDISSCSLTPECINYLIEKNKFNYSTWSANITKKNIDILIDDDFVQKYNVDLSEVLSNSKVISTCIYRKFVNSPNADVRKNILLHYIGPELSLETILDNADILQMDMFRLPKVVEELKKADSKIQFRLLHSTRKINPLMVLYLMHYVYIPNEILDTIDDIDFLELNLSEDSPDSQRFIHESQSILSDLIERYPVNVIDKLIENLYWCAKEVLMNSSLLKKLLIECDGLSENMLTTIQSAFVLTNTRTELLNYAKNYNYELLAASLQL